MRALAGASRSLGLRLDMYVLHSINGVKDFGFRMFPDPREDLKSRSPNSGPYTFQKKFYRSPIRGSTVGSSWRSGQVGGLTGTCAFVDALILKL